MSFSSRLKERRESLGMSRNELAEAINVTPSAIGNYENGISFPKEEILYKIFSVLKVEPNYLWQDEMSENSHQFVVSFPEQEYIKKYRALDQYGKNTVDAVLNCENERCMQSGVAIPISELSGSSDNSSKEDSKTSKLAIVAMGGNGVEVKEIPADADERVLKILQEMDGRKNQP